ncbi:hypothetical protein NKG05_11080 [Oerskovia sp. M15]
MGDIDTTTPGGENLAQAQDHLATYVQSGDRLNLVLDQDRSSLTAPIYKLVHEDVPVARTSRGFGEDLVARIRTIERGRRSWPKLSGARVESVATVAGEAQSGTVGRHGLWLAPAIAGIVDLDWKEDPRA